MYTSTLQIIMKVRGLNQSDISKIAGISRQSVSLWFTSKSDFQNIQILHLMKLSNTLHISMDELTKPMPLISDKSRRKALFAEFCWDYLYPDVDAFFVALTRHRYPALARMVQCRGMFESAHLLGNIIWKSFLKYCHYIHPARRKECHYIWTLQTGRTAG